MKLTGVNKQQARYSGIYFSGWLLHSDIVPISFGTSSLTHRLFWNLALFPSIGVSSR